MRIVILAAMVGFGMLFAAPANAHDWKRLEHECRHGNQHACHLINLHRRCERGDHHACRELR